MTGYKHFNKQERLEISILLKKGYSQRDVGTALKKDHSSLSREIMRNSTNGIYDPEKANRKSSVRRHSSKFEGMKVRNHSELENFVSKQMKCFWTPEQIAGRWNSERFVNQSNKPLAITAKSIYKYLYSSYGQSLCKYLPSQRYKKKKHRPIKKTKRQLIPNRIPISQRPSIVKNRIEFGHFEGDTLGKIKSENSVVAGNLEMLSRKIFLKKVPRLKYSMEGFKENLNPYHQIIKSLTLDNGVENTRYGELHIPTFFAKPYCSNDKASMESAFKRLRRFIPKKSSLKKISHKRLSKIENIMNSTPRKCLHWRTPNEIFNQHFQIL
ncbi:MAG: IS30 family transposase [Parcubacteria group bacterium Gr01-1014_18]|nr:MAG: IS30 family transposase [Parcubacteria group bacterium Greene0416_36]TSC80019.1 MAG: IS30 family transposase [Parcubacteria group bacterium Gr01-1014_18]TSC98113.1 MAG: IS30 family transposase [Parcubacteria group bacterium Greene1014_20]TSD06629.1 MAG: IS30 family transposase [Parcubacteria group bacterium Greene0714_2]